jgi:hypothetical protein
MRPARGNHEPGTDGEAMSAAEIADNKWETESTKPPVKTAGAIGQITLIGGLSLFFSYILLMSAWAIVSPKQENDLEEQFKNLKGAAAPVAEKEAE